MLACPAAPRTVVFSAPGHCWPTPPPETPGHSQVSLGQSLVRSLFPSPGAHKVLTVPSRSLFPQSCRSSAIKSHWPPKSNSPGFSVPLPDPQVGKSVVGPRTFSTVREHLWYNCSQIYGSSAQLLYGGANGDFLQEDLCHVPRLPGLLQPEPLSPCGHCWPVCPQVKGRSGSVSVGSLGPGAYKVLFEPSKCLWQVWGLILNEIAPLLPSCWGFSFALGHGVSFFAGLQHSPVDGGSATCCNFGVLAGEDEHHPSTLPSFLLCNDVQMTPP